MTILILGLLLFLGMHCARIVAEPARQRFIARRGEKAWKGIYTLVSLAGFALILWGYGLARQAPVVIWSPPAGLRHLSALFNVLAFVLLAAAYVPGNRIKGRWHHPMVLGVKTWAFGHLLVNGNLADVLLFGGFMMWAAASFVAARKRDRAAGTSYPPGALKGTLMTVAIGVVGALAFALWLHGPLIGVRPFG